MGAAVSKRLWLPALSTYQQSPLANSVFSLLRLDLGGAGSLELRLTYSSHAAAAQSRSFGKRREDGAQRVGGKV